MPRSRVFRSHRLRVTFAVELLLAGVVMEDIWVLLEHPDHGAVLRAVEQIATELLVRVVREAAGRIGSWRRFSQTTMAGRCCEHCPAGSPGGIA